MPNEDGESIAVETLFICFLNPEGHWQASLDLTDLQRMTVQRAPQPPDIIHAVSRIQLDFQAQATAAHVIGVQRMAAQEMVQKLNNDKVAAATAGGVVDLSKLRP